MSSWGLFLQLLAWLLPSEQKEWKYHHPESRELFLFGQASNQADVFLLLAVLLLAAGFPVVYTRLEISCSLR